MSLSIVNVVLLYYYIDHTVVEYIILYFMDLKHSHTHTQIYILIYLYLCAIYRRGSNKVIKTRNHHRHHEMTTCRYTAYTVNINKYNICKTYYERETRIKYSEQQYIIGVYYIKIFYNRHLCIYHRIYIYIKYNNNANI